jgi:RHS repeat-associated protein
VVTPANDFLRPGFPGQSQVLADLYYNRARDYDPITGRYIQADPIGLAGGGSPYIYANSDPVNLIDPRGEAFFLAVPLIGGIGGGLSDVGIQAFFLWRRGCDVLDYSNYNWSDVAVSAAFGAAVPGPLSAIKNTYGRYKKLKDAPRGLNRRPYADADRATVNDALKQLARGAAGAGVKNAADGVLD